MVEIKYEIEFLTYWHAGSGLTAGTQADAVMIKDENGLPYFPGKTLKGIFRDAFISLQEAAMVEELDEVDLFGQKNESGNNELLPSRLFFSNAEMPEKEALTNSTELITGLYDTLASTEIGKKGVAEQTSLRVIEAGIPLSLSGSISGFASKDEAEEFSHIFAFTKALGGHRNRGLGRCIIRKSAIQ